MQCGVVQYLSSLRPLRFYRFPANRILPSLETKGPSSLTSLPGMGIRYFAEPPFFAPGFMCAQAALEIAAAWPGCGPVDNFFAVHRS